MMRKTGIKTWNKNVRKIQPKSQQIVVKTIEPFREETVEKESIEVTIESKIEESESSIKNTKTMTSLLPSLKIIIVEWFLSSTAHALPNIFRTSNIILKIIWLCCFLASGSYCLYSVSKSLEEFLNYPTTISTKIIREVPTKFPAISVCNLNVINYTAAADYIEANWQDVNYSGADYNFILYQTYVIRTIISQDKNLTDSARRSMGYELKNMLVSCIFNYKKCDENDFTYFYDPLYGNCYTFNKGVYDNGSAYEVKTVSKAGPSYGLILELFLGDPYYESVLQHNYGIAFSVHNQSKKPFLEEERLVVPTGADTDIVVSRNFISNLEYLYGDCLKDISETSKFSSDIFDYIVRKLKGTYSQKHCFALCMQKEIINKCNCSNTFLPVFDDPVYCPTIENCIIDVVNNFGNLTANEDCKKTCPFECDSIEYITSSYKAHYPTDLYKDWVLFYNDKIYNSYIGFSELNTAIAKVNIYYKDMQYISTEELPLTNTETFFANIGGTLGLYLGISILSIVEVVELTFNLVLALVSHNRTRRLINT